MTVELAAGVDVGKLWLDVAVEPLGRSFREANGEAGIARLVTHLQRAGARRVILEAIGPYGWPAVRGMQAAGLEVGLVNPRRIKAFRDAEGRRAKTDRLDAKLIARFALHMSEQLRPLPSAEQQQLRALATRRRQLVEMIAMEKTRLKQAEMDLLAQSHRRAIASLGEQRQAVEAEIAARLAADPALSRRYDILTSLPGVGPQTATALITDLPELGTADRRAIASLAGLAPHPNRSGLAPGRNQIAGGRPCVRAALYMAALSASRCHPRYKADYRQLRDQGKPAKVAIIAVARKLLVLANTLVRNDTPYDPDLTSQQSA